MNYPTHSCNGTDDDGRQFVPSIKGCHNCHRSWCDRCEPSPAAMCIFCNTGATTSPAAIPPRQARTLWNGLLP